SKLLKENPVDIVCMGIGENGHIAFNDPHVADFNDPKLVKYVELDEMCRNQQVNDGCFAKIDDVPKYAMTLTIPALVSAKYNFCIVPAPTKAQAVKNTVCGEISEKCPASILRRKDNAILYCDADSSAEMVKRL
ncbi:MAG: 6-phosphogluconolactonase, partial [Clostridia bacterium]|nr:6-phosphogluconolactonase [Clostridia bacterium]